MPKVLILFKHSLSLLVFPNEGSYLDFGFSGSPHELVVEGANVGGLHVWIDVGDVVTSNAAIQGINLALI